MTKVIKYRITFEPHRNPRGKKDALEEALRGYLKSHRMKAYISGLGGSRSIWGLIERWNGNMNAAHVALIRQWLLEQPVSCTAVLSSPQIIEECDHLSEITGDEFIIDNLTESERQIAADEARELSEWVAANSKKPRKRKSK